MPTGRRRKSSVPPSSRSRSSSPIPRSCGRSWPSPWSFRKCFAPSSHLYGAISSQPANQPTSQLPDRSPPSIRNEEDRAVHRTSVSQAHVLVQHFPAAKLHHELLEHLRLGGHRLNRCRLDVGHASARRRDDAHGIPHL